jgi:hypothetical protein
MEYSIHKTTFQVTGAHLLNLIDREIGRQVSSIQQFYFFLYKSDKTLSEESHEFIHLNFFNKTKKKKSVRLK